MMKPGSNLNENIKKTPRGTPSRCFLLNIKLYEKSIVVSWELAVNGFVNYF